jgi:DNA-binding winged helix-turn-helix (wHTH) protein/TolB-like protein/Flp pilus assembly protein TadD
MGNSFNCLYEFGAFCLDPAQRRLSRNGEPVHIPPKAFEVLVFLVQHAGDLVDKHELIEAVWPGVFVEEGNVTVAVHTLRKALSCDERDQKYIETISKRGYRFSAQVRAIEGETSRSAEPPGGGSLIDRGAQLEPADTPSIPAEPEDPVEVPGAKILAPSSTGELRGRKRFSFTWLAAALILLPVLLITKRLPTERHYNHSSTATSIHSLAVLPFTIIGEKSNDAYLGVAMADAVTTKLDNTGSIVIRPTSALESYVGALRNPIAAGREQAVDAVLDGHVQLVGGRLRLTTQLIRVEDGARVWGETFDEKYTNLFSAQDAIAEEVARSLRVQLTGAQQNRTPRRQTENSEAYRAYIKGRYFWNRRTISGLWKGLKYFQDAVALDPTYAQAFAGIADSYALLGEYTALAPNVAFPIAKRNAEKALELDPDLAEAHANVGFVNLFYGFDGIAAENEFRRALQSNPNYAIAHTWYGVDLAALGRHREAIAEAKRAEAVDPLSLTVTTDIGLIFYLAGRTDEAIASIKKAIDIDPNFSRAHFRLGSAYMERNMNREALAEFQKAVQLTASSGNHEDQHYDASIAMAYARLGNTNESRRLLTVLLERSKHEYVPAYGIALIYSGLGEEGKVLEWLRLAYKQRCSSIAYLNVDPALEKYRSEPQFARQTKSMRF